MDSTPNRLDSARIEANERNTRRNRRIAELRLELDALNKLRGSPGIEERRRAIKRAIKAEDGREMA